MAYVEVAAHHGFGDRYSGKCISLVFRDPCPIDGVRRETHGSHLSPFTSTLKVQRLRHTSNEGISKTMLQIMLGGDGDSGSKIIFLLQAKDQPKGSDFARTSWVSVCIREHSTCVRCANS